MAASFEMLALTLLPLEEVLPGSTVSGVGERYFSKLPGILSTVLDNLIKYSIDRWVNGEGKVLL